MIHPNTEIRFINEEVGYGVVAKELIAKGTITWVLDKFDREFTPDQYDALEPIYKNILKTYAYKNNLGNIVLCWDNGRFINHSLNANCFTTAYNFELAVRDIQPGEQLTNDYSYFNIDTSLFRGIDKRIKRKIVYPDDTLKCYKSWDKKLIKAFKYISKVKQPLIGLLDEELWQLVVQIEKGTKEMESILENYNYRI
ncbi:SET domain-containing protein [Aquimarina mytili]|uniref:SET domain-containing protein n=1 Tax=Aquimarina mytili TaxID=874423 RepID=A0A936ZWK5_9FLAO|nr:SET domain-containing protein [Aquimarina mytili]MBL0682366.1 SET domain-containing protein [Aquimarina mytili]